MIISLKELRSPRLFSSLNTSEVVPPLMDLTHAFSNLSCKSRTIESPIISTDLGSDSSDNLHDLSLSSSVRKALFSLASASYERFNTCCSFRRGSWNCLYTFCSFRSVETDILRSVFSFFNLS